MSDIRALGIDNIESFEINSFDERLSEELKDWATQQTGQSTSEHQRSDIADNTRKFFEDMHEQFLEVQESFAGSTQFNSEQPITQDPLLNQFNQAQEKMLQNQHDVSMMSINTQIVSSAAGKTNQNIQTLLRGQ
ncbi:MAG: hypothetical protein HWE34_17600 [Methylocystaceae bacterium]|nr:hypothetical protein [Methylocystaceae bacterium]